MISPSSHGLHHNCLQYEDCSDGVLGMKLFSSLFTRISSSLSSSFPHAHASSFLPLSQEVFSFLGLTDLDLSENDILFLPPAISQLGNLTSLNLGKNSECREGRGGEGRGGEGGREGEKERVKGGERRREGGRGGRGREGRREGRGGEGSKFLLTVQQKETIYMSRM